MHLTLTVLCLALIGLAAAPAGAQEGSDGAPRIALETSKGRIVLELDPANAPKSTENFLTYVRDGFYDGTIFHRVIPGFMNQGGGFGPGLAKKDTRGPIQNEADNGLKNDKYTVAMARTNDPHSATAQFFINTADNAFLNHTGKNPQGWGYAVFGRVIEGQDVVDAIAGVPTGRSGGMGDVPKEDVVIQSAEVIGGGDDSEAESGE